jgi:hypothetical protein
MRIVLPQLRQQEQIRMCFDEWINGHYFAPKKISVMSIDKLEFFPVWKNEINVKSEYSGFVLPRNFEYM